MNALQEYAEAIRLKAKGDLDGAATSLSHALGSPQMLPAVRNSLDVLLNPHQALSEPMLKQMLKQVQSGQVPEED